MTDHYLWPGTDCLRNRLGVRDAQELAVIEQRLAGVRYGALAARPLPGGWDAEHLCRFHKGLFRDVYSWAGELRTVDLGKDGFWFCNARFLPDQLDELFRTLAADDYLTGLAGPSFLDKFAVLYGDINVLHPFREGNGRTQRAFLRQFAAHAQWSVNWEELKKEDNDEMCRDYCFNGDPAGLVELLRPIVSPIA